MGYLRSDYDFLLQMDIRSGESFRAFPSLLSKPLIQV